MGNKRLEQSHVAEVFERWIRSSGWLFMDASIVLEEKGLTGKMCIRQWMRRWGVWRGRQARKGHQAVGYEINMINLMRHWDSSAAVTESLAKSWEKARWTPCNVVVDTPDEPGNCPQSCLWREHDFWMDGHVHCDEFHTMYCRGYHPQAQVVLPECIMKNDPACTFSWMMPPDAEPAPVVEPYEGEDVLLDWAEGTKDEMNFRAMRRKSRVTAGRIYFLREVIYEMFPEDADDLFRRIMERWTRDRGADLKAYLDQKGVSIGFENLLENFDYPYNYLWEVEAAKKDGITGVEIGYCPYAETWKWLDRDYGRDSGRELGEYYCKRCYKNVFETANPGIEVELTACRMCGDKTCHMVVKDK